MSDKVKLYWVLDYIMFRRVINPKWVRHEILYPNHLFEIRKGVIFAHEAPFVLEINFFKTFVNK